MIARPDKWTLVIGVCGVLVLFVPIPLITQFIGLPMVVYACYRYWGRDDLGADSWGIRAAADDVAADAASRVGSSDDDVGSDAGFSNDDVGSDTGAGLDSDSGRDGEGESDGSRAAGSDFDGSGATGNGLSGDGEADTDLEADDSGGR